MSADGPVRPDARPGDRALAPDTQRLQADECLITPDDLASVSVIEEAAYEFPWTPGNLRDSLAAGHLFHGLRAEGGLVAYAILMPVLDEAHLLNLTVAPQRQGQGWGRLLLECSLRLAAVRLGARSMLLEVRPSNLAALGLYAAYGFRQIGRRSRYYPSLSGREDALVFRRGLP